jgi:hypothetical protein
MQAWELQADGSYVRPEMNDHPETSAQSILLRRYSEVIDS